MAVFFQMVYALHFFPEICIPKLILTPLSFNTMYKLSYSASNFFKLFKVLNRFNNHLHSRHTLRHHLLVNFMKCFEISVSMKFRWYPLLQERLA